jgi:hypothetical protein
MVGAVEEVNCTNQRGGLVIAETTSLLVPKQTEKGLMDNDIRLVSQRNQLLNSIIGNNNKRDYYVKIE